MTRTFSKTTLLAAVGALALVGAAPAFAASAATDAFVANVRPNVDFLDQSSRLAIKTSTDAKVRTFARGEATDQTLAGNQLVAWTETQTPTGVAAAVGVPVVAPVLDGTTTIVEAPLSVAANVTDGVDGVLTGRSVAVEAPVVTVTRPRTPAPGTLLPSGDTDMTRLSGLTGHRFDTFYMTTQKDALRQLVTLYTDYARDGDDPALRAMATRQLPIVKHRLAQLSAM